MLANVGDSRAVLGTTSNDGNLVAVQLTVDFKPNLPRKCFSFGTYSYECNYVCRQTFVPFASIFVFLQCRGKREDI